MIRKPSKWQKGDAVAIVSLSSGIAGESACHHQVLLGMERLRSFGLEPRWMPNSLKGADYLAQHPEARAADLKQAFADPTIRGIICAIGGDDTYRLTPYLLEDAAFVDSVQRSPKIFMGYSDTTVNHLLLYQLGLCTFYGPSFLPDFAELDQEMLPYTAQHVRQLFEDTPQPISASPIWYEERHDFSERACNTPRVAHRERQGFDWVQGNRPLHGRLLGGCVESLYELLSGSRHPDERRINEQYQLFPSEATWRDKVVFLETSEEQPTPERLHQYATALKEAGVFAQAAGVLIGKPQDNVHAAAYREVWQDVLADKSLPLVMNLNFGHAHPKCILPYDAPIFFDVKQQRIVWEQSFFAT